MMQTKIENYSFQLNEEDNTISVYYRNNINAVTIIRPDKKISTQKELDTECTYWWFEFGR